MPAVTASPVMLPAVAGSLRPVIPVSEGAPCRGAQAVILQLVHPCAMPVWLLVSMCELSGLRAACCESG